MITWRSIIVAAFAALLAVSAPANAEWHEASSDRFVIYSNSRADDLKQFGEMLERYHVAMEIESGRSVPKPSPSNRLTIYMVGSDRNLRDLYGDRGSSVAGFYIPRANGSAAFVPNMRISSGEPEFALRVLLHEYAHHFLISSARHAMPRWLSEGSAEYFASARFGRDGSVDIGLPNNDRAYEISQAADVSLAELLDYDLYRERQKSRRYDAYYGRSWLLFHYLAFSDNRKGQLEAYWQAVTSGAPSTEAAEAIFGDLDALEDEIFDYGRSRKMSGMRYSADAISIGDVSVQKLSKGHAAMMPLIMQSKRGVSDEEAAEVVATARDVAASYGDDAHVQAALAEAEFDAGNLDAAIAAADRAIAADRNVKNAYVQKGYALFAKADDADNRDAAYSAAMKPFQALNALEADHTQPLVHYYQSFVRRGVMPPEGARHALERASELAPFDHSLAMNVALMQVAEGKSTLAGYLLAPVAANPHGGKRAARAQAIMEILKSVPDGQRVDISGIANDDDDNGSEDASDGDGDGKDEEAADE
jgi:tetratricopeptide (TPR) repeat protein